MGVVVVTPATNFRLTTLGRVLAELGDADDVTTQTAQDVLYDLIGRASSAIARECRRVFAVETVAETLDGSGSRLLALSRVPILSITSVLEDTTTIAASEYSVEDAEAGALYRENGWGRSMGLRMWGTEAYSSGYVIPGLANLRYTVTYQAGYVLPGATTPTLPGAVEQACIETVKAWWNGRGGEGGVSEVAIDDIRIKYGASTVTASTGTLPVSAMALLRNYRRGYV